MNAARVGKLTRIVQIPPVVEAWKIVSGVKPVDGPARDRGKRRVAFRGLLERRLEHLALPARLVRLGSRTFHTETLYVLRADVRRAYVRLVTCHVATCLDLRLVARRTSARGTSHVARQHVART